MKKKTPKLDLLKWREPHKALAVECYSRIWDGLEEGGPVGEAANLKGMAIRETELEWIDLHDSQNLLGSPLYPQCLEQS